MRGHCSKCGQPKFMVGSLCARCAAQAGEGRALAQDAMQRAEDRAEGDDPGWKERAYALLQEYPADRFMAEDVRRFAEARGLSPPEEPRAWGGIIQRASSAGLIEKDGYDESRNAQAHCRPTQVWRFKGRTEQ